MNGSKVDELKELLRKVNRGFQDAKDSLSRNDLEGTQDILGDLLSPLVKAKRSLEELAEGTSYWEVFEGDLLSEEPIRKDLYRAFRAVPRACKLPKSRPPVAPPGPLVSGGGC
jgi:hypothetical protein